MTIRACARNLIEGYAKKASLEKSMSERMSQGMSSLLQSTLRAELSKILANQQLMITKCQAIIDAIEAQLKLGRADMRYSGFYSEFNMLEKLIISLQNVLIEEKKAIGNFKQYAKLQRNDQRIRKNLYQLRYVPWNLKKTLIHVNSRKKAKDFRYVDSTGPLELQFESEFIYYLDDMHLFQEAIYVSYFKELFSVFKDVAPEEPGRISEPTYGFPR